jgi:hypothetical protein
MIYTGFLNLKKKKKKKNYLGQAWWCMPVIPAFSRLRQEDPKFKASLGFIVIERARREKSGIFS